MVAVPREGGLEVRERVCDALLVEREEARERRREVDVVVEPDDGPVDDDALGVRERDVEAAPELDACVLQGAAPLQPEDREAVVQRDACAVAAAGAAAEERAARADGLRRWISAQCFGYVNGATHLDVFVGPGYDLAVQRPQRHSYLAPAPDVMTRVLLHVVLELRNFSQDHQWSVVIAENL